MYEITAAAISLVGVILTALITNGLIKYRLQKLEEKVDKHNKLIERTYILETKVDFLEKEMDK